MPTHDLPADALEATDVTATPEEAGSERATIEEIDARPLPEVAPATATKRRRRSLLGVFRRTAGGVGAVGVKELRGRMRGRRAFVIISLYLVLLAGFAWMVELIMERTYSTGFGARSRPSRCSPPRRSRRRPSSSASC
jgi:hypothetical protein